MNVGIGMLSPASPSSELTKELKASPCLTHSAEAVMEKNLPGMSFFRFTWYSFAESQHFKPEMEEASEKETAGNPGDEGCIPENPVCCNSLSLLATFQLNAADRRKFVDILLNGQAVCLQLGTASDLTIISESLWQLHDAADFPVCLKRVRWSRRAN
ncbi:unnamed protein product [Schistocephalus solidus]|uniref:Uncharacterized protein n=1 Tax=Schistocephalus solidus TaxID=70667 RepID=A0A183SQT8_SCHSO|nr:unnamed protein product [Schistocephalus solidus]